MSTPPQVLQKLWLGQIEENHSLHKEVAKLREIIRHEQHIHDMVNFYRRQEKLQREARWRLRSKLKGKEMAFLDNEENEKKGLVVPFTSFKGGKEDGEDWLSGLSVGTNFLIKPIVKQDPRMGIQPDSPNLLECTVEYKVEKAVALELDLNGQLAHIWVDPLVFSRQNKLHSILEVPTLDE